MNRAPSLTQRLGDVPLTDEGDKETLSTLKDGLEVEILGWRQRPSVRYNVRCVGSGTEGWVLANYLRASKDPPPETSPVADELQRVNGDMEQQPLRSGAQARRAPVIVERIAKSPRAAQSDRAVPCPVCGKETHPYNLSRNTKDVVVGCYVCSGRRP